MCATINGMKQNFATSFRLSEKALELLKALEQDSGLKRSAVIELALRDLAKKRGLEVRE